MASADLCVTLQWYDSSLPQIYKFISKHLGCTPYKIGVFLHFLFMTLQPLLNPDQIAQLTVALAQPDPHIPLGEADGIVPAQLEEAVTLLRDLVFPGYFTSRPTVDACRNSRASSSNRCAKPFWWLEKTVVRAKSPRLSWSVSPSCAAS